MLHRGIKYAHAALLVFASLLAFFGVKSSEEWGLVGQSATIWVTDATDVSATRVTHTLTKVARAHKATVARALPDLQHPDFRRHFYLAIGDPRSPSAAWLTDGFPSFGRDVRTDVHRIDEISDRDPRGFYHVFGPPQTAWALHDAFTDLCLTSEVIQEPGLVNVIAYVSGGALSLTFLTIGLAVVVTVGSCVLLSARTYGVLRLHGMSFGGILARDIRQLALFWISAFGLVAVAALVFLGSYNGFSRLGLFTLAAFGVWAVLGLTAIAAHTVALGLTFRTAPLRALKGELAARPAMVCAYLVRVPAVLLAFIVSLSCVHAGQEVLTRATAQEMYAKVGDATTIRLSGSFAHKAEGEVVTKVGRWIRREDKEGKIILVHPSLTSRKIPRVANVLIVNQTFLDEQPVVDLAGRPHGLWPQSEEELRVIVPTSLAPYASSIPAAVREELSLESKAAASRIKTKTLLAKSGQTVFTYDVTSRLRRGDPTVEDPVLVVVPNGSAVISNGAYTASVTQDEVIFKDPRDVHDALRDPELRRMVLALSAVTEKFAFDYQKATHEFRLSVATLVVALVVVFLANIGVNVVYTRKNAQAMFVKHISGWRFMATHRVLLGAESLLLMIPLVWNTWQTWSVGRELAAYKDAGIPPPPHIQPPAAWETLLAGGVTGLGLVMALAALTAFHRRIIRERTAGV